MHLLAAGPHFATSLLLLAQGLPIAAVPRIAALPDEACRDLRQGGGLRKRTLLKPAARRVIQLNSYLFQNYETAQCRRPVSPKPSLRILPAAIYSDPENAVR